MASADKVGSGVQSAFGLGWLLRLPDKVSDLLRSRELFRTEKPERYEIGSVYKDTNGCKFRITRHRHLGIVDLGVMSSPLTLVYGIADRNDRGSKSSGGDGARATKT